MNGRNLQPGDKATTDYNKGLITKVEIRERREQPGTQSCVQYRVFPALHGGYPSTWYDADWFEPALPDALEKAISEDGAIRCVDGRWSGGFVDESELEMAISNGLLSVETRNGMRFAVRSNAGVTGAREAKRPS